jgi:hypothetical protein
MVEITILRHSKRFEFGLVLRVLHQCCRLQPAAGL